MLYSHTGSSLTAARQECHLTRNQIVANKKINESILWNCNNHFIALQYGTDIILMQYKLWAVCMAMYNKNYWCER